MHRPLLALLFLLAISALAQLPAPPSPAANPNSAPQPGGDELVGPLQFPNTDVTAVLGYYERLTGKRVVYDNTVQGPVNIVINKQLPKEEAIRIIEITLLLNGFTLVPSDRDIIKVIGTTKNPRIAGVPILSDPEQIPDGDRVITFLFKLQYADPTELQQMLAQFVAPQLYTNIVALPKAQAVLVTENSSVIRGILKVVGEIDVPPAAVISEFVALERADAKDIIEKLEKIFEKTPSPTGGTGSPAVANAVARAKQVVAEEGVQPPNPPGIEIPGGALTEEGIIIGKIKLTADIRTNRIHVVTRPINLPFVRKLIHEFDSDIKFGEPTTRPLKFVSAGDVLPVVVKAITEPGAKPEEGQTAPGAARPPTRQGGSQGGGTTAGGTSSGGTGSDFSVSEGLSTEPADTTPEAVTVGSTKIIADKRANSIIVLGNDEVKQKIFKVLDQIDIRAPQVMLQTVIGELTLNNDREFGIDYLYARNLVQNTTGTTGTTTTTDTTGTTAGTTTTTTTNAPIAAAIGTGSALISRNTSIPLIGTLGSAFGAAPLGGLSAYIAATNSLQAIVRALESTSRFHVTSRPMVFTSNNKKAIIASGQEIAVPTQTLTSATTTANEAAVSSSIQYKRVALQLEVVPLINSDKEVALDILQKIDSVVPGSSTNVGGTIVPTIATRYVRTNVSVANESTVVLGGLITKTNNTSSTGLPFISRIPVLGYLFKDTSKTNARGELIILIRPVVTTRPIETIVASEREQEHLTIQPDLEATIDPPGTRQRVKRPLFTPRVPLRE